MRRRGAALLARRASALARLLACCRTQPYVAAARLAAGRAPAGTRCRRGRGGRVLLVRTMRPAPGLEARGLQWLQRDGSVHVDFYEQWAVPPAQAVEDDAAAMAGGCGAVRAVLRRAAG